MTALPMPGVAPVARPRSVEGPGPIEIIRLLSGFIV